MNWLAELLTQHSIAQTVIIYGLLIATGITLGKLRILGISLGVTWILFAGILVSYAGISTDKDTMYFLRDFGLILFVYSIGLQVGPGFFASLKKNALLSNILAAAIVLLGVLITVLFFLFSGNHISIMTGVMSGAVTNTPGLGAAQAAINDLHLKNIDTSLVTLAYAVAYPFGVIGIILSLVILQKVLGVNIDEQRELHRKLSVFQQGKPISVHLRVDNKQLVGQTLRSLFSMLKEPIVVSRMYHNGEVITPTPDTKFAENDVLLVVAPRSLVNRELKMLVGGTSEMNLKKQPDSHLISREILVTNADVTHKRLGDIAQLHQHNFTLSRLNRAGVEIVPSGNLYLQLGDIVKAVGTEEGVNEVTQALGNSLKKLELPDLAPIFMGIVLGVLLGSIPFGFPSMPVPVKIGLAGGPLIVALLLSRFGGALYLNNYTTRSANLMIRELGITLFLASVGLSSGHNLAAAFADGSGWYWMLMGIAITMLPLLVVGYIANKYFRKTYFEVCGLLAGASTDPPALAFAIKAAGSDIPSATYATVYPLTMILRIVAAQLLIMLFS
jgi:putative transport protein